MPPGEPEKSGTGLGSIGPTAPASTRSPHAKSSSTEPQPNAQRKTMASSDVNAASCKSNFHGHDGRLRAKLELTGVEQIGRQRRTEAEGSCADTNIGV